MARIGTMWILMMLVAPAWGDDFTTMQTVTIVVNCMDANGGQTEENLYACACRRDVIASKMSGKEYEDANLFELYRTMPADKGQVYRDSEKGQALVAKLSDARKAALAQCPLIKQVIAPPQGSAAK